MKNINFVREDIQGILSSHKIYEKYKKRDVFYIKNCTETFPNIHRKTPVLVSLFNKGC